MKIYRGFDLYLQIIKGAQAIMIISVSNHRPLCYTRTKFYFIVIKQKFISDSIS